jgi:hypothetical protein
MALALYFAGGVVVVLVGSFGFSTWMIMSFANEDSFISSFPMCTHLIYFYCLTVSEVVREDILALFLISVRNLPDSHITYNVNCRFLK